MSFRLLTLTLLFALLSSCAPETPPPREPTPSELALQLRSPDTQLRIDAATRLRNMGRDADVAAYALTLAMRDENHLVRVIAAGALARLGRTHLPTLLLALRNDASDDVRAAVAAALPDTRASNAEILAPLTLALQDHSEIVRAKAIVALERLGPAALPAVRRAALDESSLVRSVADAAAKRIRDAASDSSADNPARARDLVSQLQSSSPYERAIAAQELGKSRTLAQTALPALTRALDDDDSLVRVAATGALRSCGAQALNPLRKALRDKDASVRAVAAEGLGRLGRHALPALPDLANALSDRELGVRISAVSALERLGPQATSSIRAALNDRDWFVRKRAAEALDKLASASR